MKQEFHPEFISRYKDIFKEEEFNTFLEYCSKPLKKSIRVNISKISLEEFENIAKTNNWLLEKIPYLENAYNITDSELIGKSIEYFCGLFYIQETSSMIPPIILDPQEGDIILDMSAAPGSKTTQLANLINNNGLIIANDISGSRIKALKSNINSQGSYSVAVSKLDGRDFGNYYYEYFDKILLDAPCSAEGSMRKDKFNWSIDIIDKLSSLQMKMILSALLSLKVGGELVYSTCTMTPEEDEMIVDFVLSNLGDFVEIVDWEVKGLKTTPGITSWKGEELHPDCKKSKKIWPHHNDTEGFFIAKFKKIAKINTDFNKEYFPKKSQEKILKSKDLKILFSQIKKRFNIDKTIFKKLSIIKKDSSLTIRTKYGNSMSTLPNIHNMGIPFGEEVDNKFLLNFYSAQTFGKYADKNIIKLNKNNSEKFIKGLDIILDNIELNNSELGQVIISYNNIILGTSLLQKNNKLKNQVPRENIKM
ncbi:MAG: NOL1/NOP2/sun family putative RNA methylase [Candidatus Gracilibacteria bacterium]|nr:NOL1/NOP2/sun family putative RNA methylase [Candidatus Gracilibacteria bacterium]MDQ7022312.1 NOL1/NOP2/sun family putative RNA methylase [Candidatus Gracilibacteria bacterium]